MKRIFEIKPTEKSLASWYFLIAVIISYVIIYFTKPKLITPALKTAYNITLKIIPVIIVIFVLMATINYFIKPKELVKYLGKGSGVKGWLLAIGTGIISTGPIYMWYPLLADLQKKGMRNALIATFLYNRAVKPALIPLMVVYFGALFVCVLTIVMVLASVAEGWIVEKLLEAKI
ncbi:hypothetical protein GF374_02370 [Candidatus Woesearchaeota archaeon]|nr:hypothetical protein [Candidatus Woesearchaeota archaeon]